MEIFECQPLFDAVQLGHVFVDSKTFVDCTPLQPLPQILERFKEVSEMPDFDLKQFVLQYFELPVPPQAAVVIAKQNDAEAHIRALWPALTRLPDLQSNSSLIPLPGAYVVPGGRFGEVYYWDSYFTMLGLQACGHINLMESMVDNFTHLILQVGFIPNGNRTYYLGRSQPPYYALMVQLLAGIKGEQVLEKYLPALLAEYEFWMKGATALHQAGDAKWHVVMMPDASILNRYCDLFETPRPESYREDIELAHQSLQSKERVYKNLRAGAESGWDFSSRWFAAGGGFETIETAEVVPVDLNCLIWHLELTIAQAYRVANDVSSCENYTGLAMKRAVAINKFCWNEVEAYFTDVNCNNATQRDVITLAGVMPLFSGIANTVQAAAVAAKLEASFLYPGGLITTLNFTNQQWDAPNGWAPLQWIAVTGLRRYGYNDLADQIATRWMKLNEEVFARTGKFMEKYNVVNTELEAGGGEYEGQDGFGWTNGVYMAMKVQHANR